MFPARKNLITTNGSASPEAVFSLNEDGKLIWDDQTEHAGEGHVFEKIGWFQGLWISGEDADTRYDLDCCWDIEEPVEGEVNSGYKIEIERHEGEAYTHWIYSCIYKAEENKLISFFGQKEFAEKAGEPAAVVYEDGEAEFTIDDEGCIRADQRLTLKKMNRSDPTGSGRFFTGMGFCGTVRNVRRASGSAAIRRRNRPGPR